MSRIPTETDIVVIGSGVSGLVAALTAAEAGARAIVFEKLRSLGGTSNFFKGTFAVESRQQKERYITYDRDEAFREIIEYGHWRNNPRLVRAIVDESASTLTWLEEQGVEIAEVTINMIDAPRTYHIVRGEGAAVIKILTTQAREKGVEIITGTPVKQILKEGERICSEGFPASHLFVLIKGRVEHKRPTSEGPNILVDDLIAGSIFGISSLMGADRYLLNAECTEDSEVLKIENKVLRQILDENPVVGYAVQRRISQIVFKRYLNSIERLQSVIRAIPIRSDA